MYSFQGQTYTSLHEVPQHILNAFIHHTSLTETIVFRKGLLILGGALLAVNGVHANFANGNPVELYHGTIIV